MSNDEIEKKINFIKKKNIEEKKLNQPELTQLTCYQGYKIG